MKRRLVGILGVLVLVTAGVLVRGEESLRIVPITSGDEVRSAISSGLKTAFTYDVELRMVVPAWVDQTVASAIVTTSDQFDNLTRRHSLTRVIDGRVEEATVTEDEAVVRKWLTTLTRMPLCDTSKLDPSRDYYVRIRARMRPRGGSLLGWASGITGTAKFTFIP